MKELYTLLAVILFSGCIFAQAPQKNEFPARDQERNKHSCCKSFRWDENNYFTKHNTRICRNTKTNHQH